MAETQYDPKLLDPRRKAKGRRPYFFEDPSTDKLLAITLAIAGELAVTRERLDTLERLLAAKGDLSRDEINAYRPDDDAKAERAHWRADYVARVLRIIQTEFEAMDPSRGEKEYDAVVQELATVD